MTSRCCSGSFCCKDFSRIVSSGPDPGFPKCGARSPSFWDLDRISRKSRGGQGLVPLISGCLVGRLGCGFWVLILAFKGGQFSCPLIPSYVFYVAFLFLCLNRRVSL